MLIRSSETYGLGGRTNRVGMGQTGAEREAKLGVFGRGQKPQRGHPAWDILQKGGGRGRTWQLLVGNRALLSFCSCCPGNGTGGHEIS